MVFTLNRTACAYEHKGDLCCGRKIEFYDECGHTLTHTSHHDKFPESREEWPTLTDAAKKTTLDWTQAQTRLPPSSELKCENLHCFIEVIHDKCSCEHGWDKYHGRGEYPVHSDEWGSTIPADVILQRRTYWLRQQECSREVELGFALREFEAVMVSAEVVNQYVDDPRLRIFSYDLKGHTGTFLAHVTEDRIQDSNLESYCRICNKELAQGIDLGQLPCGCVLDMSCIRRWFRSKKNCPVCDFAFRLIKVPSDRENHCPVWEDDLGAVLAIRAQEEENHRTSARLSSQLHTAVDKLSVSEAQAGGARKPTRWFFAEDGPMNEVSSKPVSVPPPSYPKPRDTFGNENGAARPLSHIPATGTRDNVEAPKRAFCHPWSSGPESEFVQPPLYTNGRKPADAPFNDPNLSPSNQATNPKPLQGSVTDAAIQARYNQSPLVLGAIGEKPRPTSKASELLRNRRNRISLESKSAAVADSKLHPEPLEPTARLSLESKKPSEAPSYKVVRKDLTQSSNQPRIGRSLTNPIRVNRLDSVVSVRRGAISTESPLPNNGGLPSRQDRMNSVWTNDYVSSDNEE